MVVELGMCVDLGGFYLRKLLYGFFFIVGVIRMDRWILVMIMYVRKFIIVGEGNLIIVLKDFFLGLFLVVGILWRFLNVLC